MDKPPFSLRPGQLLWLLCFLLSTSLTASDVAGNNGQKPLDVYLLEANAMLADKTVSPAQQEKARLGLKSKLQQAASPEERASILFVMASDAMFYRQNINESIPLWTECRKLFKTGSKDWLKSTLGLAIATQNTMPASPRTIQEAEALYQSILEHDTESLIAARALFNTGRIAELMDFVGDVQNQPKAREAYSAVFSGWPGETIAHEAAFRYANTYLQEAYDPPPEYRTNWQWRTERMHGSINFLKDWVTRHPDNSLAPGMWEFIGNIFIRMPDYSNWKSQALEAYLHSAGDQALLHGGEPTAHKTNMDRVDISYFYLRTAILAQQTGNQPVALEYYTRLMTEPGSYAIEAALQLIHNLGFTREQVIERALWQLRVLGHSPHEIQYMIEELEFPDLPSGFTLPSP